MAIREQQLLEKEVNQAIELSPYLGRNALRCETAHGRVTIRGEVNSFFQKQMATEAIRKLRGIEEIDNQLTVKDHVEADLETV
jgi:osmotically-inducible protein OsmY